MFTSIQPRGSYENLREEVRLGLLDYENLVDGLNDALIVP